ncbi:MAG TPA: hypothetical protein VHG91_05050 [Longimicrobium sp.]|nr:hypothetical protein [Longimicrobium sp.]
MNPNAGDCSDWNAWHDQQPGGPATLYVTGRCTFPTAGYTVELRPMPGHGDDRVLNLQRVVTEPTGAVPQVITTVDVRYEEATDTEYRSVVIHPGGIRLELAVVS